jgi:3-oxoacyl-[acyl-carrier-protein] synthase II
MKFSNRNRAVITGLGVVAPNGIGVENFWRTLVAGQSGIGRITRFDPSGMKSQIAGEVKDFDPYKYVGSGLKPKRRARHTQFAMAATAMAMEDAGIDLERDPLRQSLPVMMGVGSSSFEIIADSGVAVAARGARHASPTLIAESSPHSVAGALSELLAFPTRCRTFSSACAAGFDAVGEAAECIRRGEADVVVAGGTDSPISMVPLANFDNAGMSSRRNETPETACRPFDRTRDSGVLSEGSGVLIVENLEHAVARGAKPYLEIAGYGVHTDPDPEKPCSGFELSMKAALANAAALPEDVDYICAWGPGHPVIDRVETEMIKRVFGKHAYSLFVSSIKGVIGNPLSAAGPMMLISCCLMFRHGLIPPTANYQEPDPECDLHYVPNVARRCRVRCALVNAHGVGGANSALIVKRVEI